MNSDSIRLMQAIQPGFDHLMRGNLTGEARKDALKLESHGTKAANDAERLWVDPPVRYVAGCRPIQRTAASASSMGRSEE